MLQQVASTVTKNQRLKTESLRNRNTQKNNQDGSKAPTLYISDTYFSLNVMIPHRFCTSLAAPPSPTRPATLPAAAAAALLWLRMRVSTALCW